MSATGLRLVTQLVPYINVQIHGPEDAQDALVGQYPLPAHGPHGDVVDGRTHRQLHDLHLVNDGKGEEEAWEVGVGGAANVWERQCISHMNR